MGRDLRRRSAAVAAIAATAVALGPMAPAGAGDGASPREDNYWGAIAISIDGAFGKSFNYATKKAALKRSKVECKEHSDYPGKCENVVYTVNGCAAVSVKFNSDGFVRRYAYAFGEERAPVVRVAQRRCVKSFGKKCVPRASVCSPSAKG